MRPFRHHHLLNILNALEDTYYPLDVFLSRYFREHKAVGSKDRKAICETLYTLVRWRGLIDAQIDKPLSWENDSASTTLFKTTH